MSSAARARRELSALGQELTAAHGGSVRRRAAALRGVGVGARTFDELLAAPDWLRTSPEALARLARQVALQASASALAASIDGRRLGLIAEQCGEDDLDAAIERVAPGDDRPLPEDAERTGMALLAATLPRTLRSYLTEEAPADVAPERVLAWIARVRT